MQKEEGVSGLGICWNPSRVTPRIAVFGTRHHHTPYSISQSKTSAECIPGTRTDEYVSYVPPALFVIQHPGIVSGMHRRKPAQSTSQRPCCLFSGVYARVVSDVGGYTPLFGKIAVWKVSDVSSAD